MADLPEPVRALNGAGSLAIVRHDSPDPDCVASTPAPEAFADAAGVAETFVLYGGRITHRQTGCS